MGAMTPTLLVLASIGLGILIGVLVTATITAARAAGRRRAAALRPELPEVAVEILNEHDSFAVILDSSLSPVYANPAARDDPRISGEQLREQDFLAQARRVMSTGITETRLPEPDDTADTVRVHLFRIQRRFLVVIAEDLGEEQRVNAMRRDFIANVSHELKTPIAAISLLSEAVHEAADEPDRVRGFAQTLMKESQRLGNLSRDIIQLSEAQGTVQPEDREPVPLRGLVRTEVDAHRTYAEQHGVELIVTEPAVELGDLITLGRQASLGVALANLLSNAIRHSPDGGRVGVGMEVTDRGCVVTVTDQGDGIPAELLPRIFERFYRVDASRSRAGGGTGLGLSIARHTMRSHGGDIEVWSQPGVGSSFSLTFPLVDLGEGPKSKKAKKPRGSAKTKKNQKQASASRKKEVTA